MMWTVEFGIYRGICLVREVTQGINTHMSLFAMEAMNKKVQICYQYLTVRHPQNMNDINKRQS